MEKNYSVAFSFSQEDVQAFAELTGDNNPLHLDAAYAAGTAFKKPIMHGMLSATIFSKVLGTEFPGPGTIYVSQELHFKRPMFTGEHYLANFEVVEIDQKRHQAVISTEIKDVHKGKVTVTGKATVLNPLIF